MCAPRKCTVNVLAQIAGEDDDTFVLFDLLEQVGHFDIRVPVVRVFHFGAFAKERVCFIEEYCIAALRGAENPDQVFSVSPLYLLKIPERSILLSTEPARFRASSRS